MCNPSLAALRVLIIKQTCFQSLGLYALERSSPDTFGLPLSVWRQANLKKDVRPEVTSPSPSTLILQLAPLALAGHQVIGWIGRDHGFSNKSRSIRNWQAGWRATWHLADQKHARYDAFDDF